MSTEDIDWKPSASLEILRCRARLLREARDFFTGRKVLEVETPLLSESGTTDPNLSHLSFRLAARPNRDVYLHTSPEHAMKRLLAAGSPDIYQICKVFRDGELGSRHQPEFTLIEWYRRNFSLDDMIEETCDLIQTLYRVSTTFGSADGAVPTVRHRYQALFMAATGLDPAIASPGDLRQCAARLTDRANDPENERFADQLGEDKNAWLDFLMSHVVIPALPVEQLNVVHHYPASQAALARLDPIDHRFAERFEVFYRGLELANGYRELCDPVEQRRRFDTDRGRRATKGLADMPVDQALLAALEHGLPDCSGVAVGFDRVIMSLEMLPDITEAMSFGFGATEQPEST